MIIKYKMIDTDIKDIEKVMSYINTDIDNLYLVQGVKDKSLETYKVFLKENDLEYCRNFSGYSFVKYKGDSYLVSKDFLNDFQIIDRLLKRNYVG